MPIIDGWEQRIEALLGDDDEVCNRNSERWRQHLLEKVALPLRMTGTEDFPWEEPYVFGGRDKGEYEELKKSNPSYTDEFDLIEIREPDENADLIALLRRVSDKKVYEVPLSWLTPTKKDEPEYLVVNDYAVWHCNY